VRNLTGNLRSHTLSTHKNPQSLFSDVPIHAMPMSELAAPDAAITDAPFEMQRQVAEQEAIAQLHAPREGSPAVLPDDLPRALLRDGVAAVNAVCTGPSASALLAHVNAKLLAAHIERDRPEGEALLGKMLCREHRYDLKLDLREVSALALALARHLAQSPSARARALGRAGTGGRGRRRVDLGPWTVAGVASGIPGATLMTLMMTLMMTADDP
jgi:hypothetical protein